MLDQVILQTRPSKDRRREQASEIHSEVQKKFFKCSPVSFPYAMKQFKRFEETGETLEAKRKLLLDAVEKFMGIMRNMYINGEVDEVKFVQPEIRGGFWSGIKPLLRHSYILENEKPYDFEVEDPDMAVTVEGKVDHALQMVDFGFASMTIEDKSLGLIPVGKKAVAQVMSEIMSEVNLMCDAIHFVPAEYVGLLQNGPLWMCIFRKIHGGKILWTYTQAPAAFEVEKEGDKRSATGISKKNCKDIAAMLEHALCNADCISDAILSPDRPFRLPLMPPIFCEDGESGGSDDEEEENKPSPDAGAAAKTPCQARGGVRTSTRRQPSSSSTPQTSGKKKHTTDWAQHSDDEYFVMPLTLANVARHAATTVH